MLRISSLTFSTLKLAVHGPLHQCAQYFDSFITSHVLLVPCRVSNGQLAERSNGLHPLNECAAPRPPSSVYG